MILHAGLIARFDSGRWRGALIEGPSGAGKSDLALRALDAGWALVADDRTLVWTSGMGLFGRAPETLAGLIEARGLGVVRRPYRAFASIDLVVACAPDDCDIERAPEFQARDILGAKVWRISLAARESSALAKLAQALSRLGLGVQPAYQASRAGLSKPLAGGDP